MKERYLAFAVLVLSGVFPMSCSLAQPPQIVLVARLNDASSIDQVARELADRLSMVATSEGQEILRPEGARGFQIYDERINFIILPAPVDACSTTATYDGKTYQVGIVSTRPGTSMDNLLRAEREFRNVVQSVGGTISPPQVC